MHRPMRQITGIHPRASPGAKNELMFVSSRGKPLWYSPDFTSTRSETKVHFRFTHFVW